MKQLVEIEPTTVDGISIRGFLGKAGVSRPTRAKALPRDKSDLHLFDDMGKPCGTECTASGIRHLTDHCGAKTVSDFLDVLCHVRLPPFPALRTLWRWRFL